jgi:hypothetical protein
MFAPLGILRSLDCCFFGRLLGQLPVPSSGVTAIQHECLGTLRYTVYVGNDVGGDLLKMGPYRLCRNVGNCQSTLRKISERRGSYLHRGGGLQSRIAHGKGKGKGKAHTSTGDEGPEREVEV